MPCCAASAERASVGAYDREQWGCCKRTRTGLSLIRYASTSAAVVYRASLRMDGCMEHERRLTFLFFLFLDCALAEGPPPRGQVTSCGHGLVRWERRGLGLAVAHARRVGLVLHSSRHGTQAAERRSSSAQNIAGCGRSQCVAESRQCRVGPQSGLAGGRGTGPLCDVAA